MVVYQWAAGKRHLPNIKCIITIIIMTGGINSTAATLLQISFHFMHYFSQHLGFVLNQSSSFKSRSHATLFEVLSLVSSLYHPLHLCLSSVCTQTALFSISVFLFRFCLCGSLPPSHTVQVSVWPNRVFLVSARLSLNFFLSVALHSCAIPSHSWGPKVLILGSGTTLSFLLCLSVVFLNSSSHSPSPFTSWVYVLVFISHVI